MKTLVSLIYILLFILSCDSKSQNANSNPLEQTKMIEKNVPLKKFNIEKYENELRQNSVYEGFVTKEGVKIDQYFLMDEKHFAGDYNRKYVKEYVQKEIYPDRFSDVFIFNRLGNPTEYERYFIKIETGVWKTYSEKGNVINQVNKDLDYPFTIQQVIDFSKEHKGNLSKYGSVKRTFDEKTKNHVYEIEWVIDEPAKNYTKAFTLDGTTGAVIKEFEKSVPWIGR